MDTQYRIEEPVRIQAPGGVLSPGSLETARTILKAYAADGVILDGSLEGPVRCRSTCCHPLRWRFAARAWTASPMPFAACRSR